MSIIQSKVALKAILRPTTMPISPTSFLARSTPFPTPSNDPYPPSPFSCPLHQFSLSLEGLPSDKHCQTNRWQGAPKRRSAKAEGSGDDREDSRECGAQQVMDMKDTNRVTEVPLTAAQHITVLETKMEKSLSDIKSILGYLAVAILGLFGANYMVGTAIESRLTNTIDSQAARFDHKLDISGSKFEKLFGKVEKRLQGKLSSCLDRLRLEIRHHRLKDAQEGRKM
ncbi:hypothetical protein B9Z19DRAFT_1066943 [Tuber borchii]|uniref:Uncharacterized protein n=1 Tax=Tuber borchii TaxID=42251 RepID=A0A2T6ZKQ0_TUBBO|nr:hypothetical protein B9Z19DRAFT_1066943 [Tuber borchii]